ncbi:hypothetical protein BCR33DRAFT_715142 [Rhizoclosmatium globosum]|uniref:Uncharacterized protein n=1 Tax=Rhizoclosmatium globosum TaxID=329046 RepID=A0A1Y2CM39_9FUNG|nr:hypothetical protein BCR33DRAFT_715142 [Rhizoclosmatium globosum]|eukprot:ORY47425.1 hypothetical protein BCR33DRAFT_715142 [Rhizoclosmatium globosum]
MGYQYSITPSPLDTDLQQRLSETPNGSDVELVAPPLSVNIAFPHIPAHHALSLHLKRESCSEVREYATYLIAEYKRLFLPLPTNIEIDCIEDAHLEKLESGLIIYSAQYLKHSLHPDIIVYPFQNSDSRHTVKVPISRNHTLTYKYFPYNMGYAMTIHKVKTQT